ncbi:MAG TPA: hypothetical protein VE913_19265 [Longimicrobium sp.]|nr:hypothetical protein [Longimicrobium sp.]
MGRAGMWLGGMVLSTLRGVERAATGSPAGSSSAANPTDAPATARAEQMLDGAGERVGHFAAIAGHRLRTAAALAREEAEDLWAEARHLRDQRR